MYFLTGENEKERCCWKERLFAHRRNWQVATRNLYLAPIRILASHHFILSLLITTNSLTRFWTSPTPSTLGREVLHWPFLPTSLFPPLYCHYWNEFWMRSPLFLYNKSFLSSIMNFKFSLITFLLLTPGAYIVKVILTLLSITSRGPCWCILLTAFVILLFGDLPMLSRWSWWRGRSWCHFQPLLAWRHPHRLMNRLVSRSVSALKEELNILSYQMAWYS